MELIKGTLGLLLLKALSDEARHGHQIMRWIRQVTEGAFQVEEGAIYPALHRLEAKGWTVAEWRTTENNRQAKYYRLTAKGRKHRDAELRRWRRYIETMGKVLHDA